MLIFLQLIQNSSVEILGHSSNEEFLITLWNTSQDFSHLNSEALWVDFNCSLCKKDWFLSSPDDVISHASYVPSGLLIEVNCYQWLTLISFSDLLDDFVYCFNDISFVHRHYQTAVRNFCTWFACNMLDIRVLKRWGLAK